MFKTKQEEVKELRQTLQMTQQEFAVALGVSIRAITKWESGESEPSHMAQEKIDRLAKRVK